jgi:hypothetical protein
MCTNSERREWISVAVVKPIGTILQAADEDDSREPHGYNSPSVKIFSALASLIPFTVHSCFLGVNATASTV